MVDGSHEKCMSPLPEAHDGVRGWASGEGRSIQGTGKRRFWFARAESECRRCGVNRSRGTRCDSSVRRQVAVLILIDIDDVVPPVVQQTVWTAAGEVRHVVVPP